MDPDDQEQGDGDLLALNDGWLPALPPDQLQLIQAPPLQQQLGVQARRFLEQQGEQRAGSLLPVGVSPWVMLFRNGTEWAEAARAGWDVLLQAQVQVPVLVGGTIPCGDVAGRRNLSVHVAEIRQSLLIFLLTFFSRFCL